MKRCLRLFLAVCSLLLFSACAGMLERIPGYGSGGTQRGDSIEPEIRHVIDALEGRNRDIKTFKGTGRITYSRGNGKEVTANIAWVAGEENRILIVIRGILGEPLARIADDGEWLCFVSHTDRGFYRKRSANASLESFISIPLKSKEIILLLSGRVPFPEFDSAVIASRNAGASVIALKKRWMGIVGKIYLDEPRKNALKIELFDSMGEIRYSASLDGENNVNGYSFPSGLLVTNERGDYFKLDIEKSWADMPVSPSIFVLHPPE